MLQYQERRGRRGFTLIELLVVVAIIALLISILLPSLSRAKEQARVAKCLSNLRGIGQAANAYLLDYTDLPWTATITGSSVWIDGKPYGPLSLFTEFFWGGGRPQETNLGWNQLGVGSVPVAGSDVYRTPPAGRPMNPYMAPQVSWSDPRRDLPQNRRDIPMELPDNFKCPSDTNPWVPGVGDPNEDLEQELGEPTWKWWGSSYPINWYWLYYYQEAPPGNQSPYNSNAVRILGGYPSPPSLGPRMLNSNAAGGYASRLVLFYENRMNYLMEAARPRQAPGAGGQDSAQKRAPGWHRQPDTHSAVFADGHADYRKFDTRFVDGTGYTTWPNRPWDGNWKQYEGY